jgi:hypothetical protein
VISVFIVEARVDDRFDFECRVSLIAEELFGSPAKLFIFFPDTFCAWAHLYFAISIRQGRKQVSEIVFPKNFQRCKAEILPRSRRSFAKAANHRSRPLIHLPLESDPRQRVFQLK